MYKGVCMLYIQGQKCYRGRNLGRNWDKSLKSFPLCYAQSPLLTDFTLATKNQFILWSCLLKVQRLLVLKPNWILFDFLFKCESGAPAPTLRRNGLKMAWLTESASIYSKNCYSEPINVHWRMAIELAHNILYMHWRDWGRGEGVTDSAIYFLFFNM